MKDYPSKIGEILESISKEIHATETFGKTPIFYDFIEVSPNNLPPECIVYKPLTWQLDKTGCVYERPLDIVLLITAEERRKEITAKLLMFGEKMKEVIDHFIETSTTSMQFIEGSPVVGFAYNREAPDSYKETKQLFTSMIVLSYLLRY